MSNRIVQALEQVGEKLTRNLGTDGAQAVEKLYRITGEKGEKVVARVAETDAEHEGKILDILKKMDENAGKDASTPLRAAENDRERALLRQQLAKALGYDGKSAEAKEVLGDVDKTKTAVAAEAEKAGHVTMVGRVNGRPAALRARAGKVDVSGMSEAEQKAALKTATRGQGDETLGDHGLTSPKPQCSCGILHDDQINLHTSMTGKNKQLGPNVHPALQNVLDQIKAGGRVGRGHGQCGEVGAISDKLWQLDPDGTKITSLDDLKAALKNSDGSDSSVFTTIIGDSDTGGMKHGDYLPPCDSCDQMLSTIGMSRVS